MKLYDEVIKACSDLLLQEEGRELPIVQDFWPDVTDRSMILRSDMAYELGSGNLSALGITLVTDEESLVPSDRVMLIGKDLGEISKDSPYARVTLVRMQEGVLKEGQALYRAIRNLEYTRYHFYPEGFMMRVSASKQKESVRVGKKALADGLSFEKTGNKMISAFHKHTGVKAVQVFYVTKESFDFLKLKEYAKQAENITKAIDHIQAGAVMDCNACNLQVVCDEVEGLRQLHFAK